MIEKIDGLVTLVMESSLAVTVSTGLTLEVFVPLVSSYQQDTQYSIYIHMHWSSEQGPTLFGFQTVIDRSVFRIMLGCSGIGPKLAIAVLAQLGSRHFIQAVIEGNDTILSQVSGIGSRKAEQLIVQLKHKINNFNELYQIEFGKESNQWYAVGQALESLHYSKIEIQQALNCIKKESSAIEKFDILLKKALLVLSK